MFIVENIENTEKEEYSHMGQEINPYASRESLLKF